MNNTVLFLPTYNEKDNIETLIDAIQSVFRKLTAYKLTIVVIDDCSPDGTGQIVKKLIKKYNNICLLSKKREGLGAAYVYGMNYALIHFKPQVFIQMDADWSHNPLLLPDFFHKLEEGADFIIGSRYIKGGSIPGNWGLHRKIFSVIGNNIVRLGLGILIPHDWTSGYRMMRVGVYKKISAGLGKYSGYTFQIASLHRICQSGFKIAEVPLQFIDRIHGRSKIPFIHYITNVLLYVFKYSSFIKYVIIGFIGFGTQTLISKLLINLKVFPGIAVAVGSVFAIICNFLGNNFWTFKHKKITGFMNLFKKFFHFILTSIGAVIIQGIVVSAGVLIFGPEAWFWLMVFAIGFLVIPYNYFIYNRFIWKKK